MRAAAKHIAMLPVRCIDLPPLFPEGTSALAIRLSSLSVIRHPRLPGLNHGRALRTVFMDANFAARGFARTCFRSGTIRPHTPPRSGQAIRAYGRRPDRPAPPLRQDGGFLLPRRAPDEQPSECAAAGLARAGVAETTRSWRSRCPGGIGLSRLSCRKVKKPEYHRRRVYRTQGMAQASAFNLVATAGPLMDQKAAAHSSTFLARLEVWCWTSDRMLDMLRRRVAGHRPRTCRKSANVRFKPHPVGGRACASRGTAEGPKIRRRARPQPPRR